LSRIQYSSNLITKPKPARSLAGAGQISQRPGKGKEE